MRKIGGISDTASQMIPSEQTLLDYGAAKGGDLTRPGCTIARIMASGAYTEQASTPARKAAEEAAPSVRPDAPLRYSAW